MTKTEIRSIEMNLQHEALARAQMAERLGEARERHRRQHLIRAIRVAREAERKVQQARLSIARSLM